MKEELKNDLIKIVNSCPNCSWGEGCFKKSEEKGLIHLDLFYSYEAGAIFTCTAAPIIKKYIKKFDKNDNPVFDEEFDEAYKKIQSFHDKDTDIVDDAVEKYAANLDEKETIDREALESHLYNVTEWTFKRGIGYRIRLLEAIENNFEKEDN